MDRTADPRPQPPHIHAGTDVGRLMRCVLYALIPGAALQVYLFGPGVAANLLLAAATAVAAEALMLGLRRRSLAALADASALLTGTLLALALPPAAPAWLVVTGSLFAIVLVKQLYGGLGYNVFNPAMAAYAMLLIAFPLEMTRWPPSLLEAGVPWARLGLDGVTAATPLDGLRTGLLAGRSLAEPAWRDTLAGHFGGRAVEWINLGYLAGGLWLLSARAITWHIPAGMLAALALAAAVAGLADPLHQPGALFHLFSGAAMLGAFFIATDPVTAATTPLGRVLFGAGCGLLVFIIRAYGGYPDAVAFAVLLMNLAAPTLDRITRPRTYGHRRRRR